MKTKKTFLGAHSTFAGRERVYEVQDAIQVDYAGPAEVQRYRVYFDDVQVITYHTYKGTVFLAVMGILGLIATLISLAVLVAEPAAGIIVFVVTAAPFLLLFGLRASMGVDSVTVYGRRSRARMSFWFGKDRARDVYRQLTERIRRHHEKSAPPPPPAEPVPPPPPLPEGPGAPPPPLPPLPPPA